MPKNGILGAGTKILRALLSVKHPPKMMELTLVFSVYHFWMGFQPFQNMQNCPFLGYVTKYFSEQLLLYFETDVLQKVNC